MTATTAPTPPVPTATQSANHVRVAIVGTGFAGLGAAIALQREGVEHTILERADDVGGTWRDNRYPGCRCDVPSHLYSFSFAPNPDWSETYSPQPEIFAYLRRTAEEHGVIERIRFGHEVREARWDAAAQRWAIDTAAGPMTADVLILGNGPLAEPAIPDLPGLDTFEGTTFHSATWRHDHDLAGERVAVIGTGASAIQFVPEIQPVVGHLTLFQRTPPWVLPHRNRRISPAERALYRRVPAAQRAVRSMVYWSRELFGTSLLRNAKSLDGLERMARKQLHEQVPDAELRARLTPDYKPGCKRLLLSNDYFPALGQPNVDVANEKIVGVRPHAVVTADGVEHAVDTIIFGTGFHVTDNPVANRLRGVGGTTLADRWASTGAQAYLGTTVPGFPNLFLLAGPNTGIGHTSLVVMIEAQLAYITDALRLMDETGAASVDVRPTTFAAWSEEIQAKAAGTVWNSGGCASWYLDAEGRNTTLWPDHTYKFRARTRRFDASSYELTAPPVPTETTVPTTTTGGAR
ncbi:MAG TPA: NAD(P)/FAD-dependent oxidoreductase [Acidimicrobiales bacterium]|nr:NAD(P)/FAD-dependent oxidoreductase [Acidimicrobiales bacterium]